LATEVPGLRPLLKVGTRRRRPVFQLIALSVRGDIAFRKQAKFGFGNSKLRMATGQADQQLGKHEDRGRVNVL